jgi:hypothetical protein
VLIAACKKDKAAGQVKPATGTFLSMVKAEREDGETVLNTITYNTDGSVNTRIGYKDYNAGLIGSKTAYTYRDGRLEHIDEQTDYGAGVSPATPAYTRSTLVYSAEGKVIQKNYFLRKDEQYELQSFTTFTCNEQGLPSMETRYAADGALTGYSLYEYDDKGNVRSASVYAINPTSPEPALASKTDYTYDNGLNPYRNIYAAVENIPFSVNRNNMVSRSFTDYSAHAVNPQPAVIQVEYTYNKNELPSSMNENGNLFSLEYQ